jgi:Ca2+/Na+ antiporter
VTGFLRLAIFGFIALTLIYVLVSIYSRSVRREKLEKEWDETHASGDPAPGDRDAFIAAGMEAYRNSLRRRLIWLVYIIPTAVVLALLYFLNFA